MWPSQMLSMLFFPLSNDVVSSSKSTRSQRYVNEQMNGCG